jgi:hypothetical protein
MPPHLGQATCEHRVLATIRTDRPAGKTRSTDTLARCRSSTPALSRSHDEHDHKTMIPAPPDTPGLNRSRKLCQSLTIVTRDKRFSDYNVNLVPA